MPAPKVDLGYAVTLPPREAIRYFESKGHKITFNWQDMWQEAHARAFTVAGVTKLDMLADIQQAVATAIATGQSQRGFVNSLYTTLQAKGWWGQHESTDPLTGEVRVLKTTPARLNLIYRPNTQSAYMAGRYKQQVENAAAEPYWRYVAVLDQKTRPSHSTLHGRVFRYDDPFWDSHYAPNGWGCRCRVDSMSEARLQRNKLTVESSAGRMVQKTVQVKNSRTGLVTPRTVAGFKDDGGAICYTDVGFSYNSGKTFVRDALAQMPSPPQVSAQNWQSLGLPRLRDVPSSAKQPAPPLLAQAPTREAAEQQLAKALGFTGAQNLRCIQTPVGTRTLWRDLLPHMVAKVEDARERFANYVLATLTRPYEIWLKNHADGNLRENYIGLFQEGKYALLVVVRINRDGSLLWNSMQRDIKKMDSLREGWLIWQKNKS